MYRDGINTQKSASCWSLARICNNVCISLQVDTTVRTKKTQIFRTNNIYRILLAGFATQTGRKLTLFAVSNCFYPPSFADDFWLVDSVIVIEQGGQVLHGIKCSIFNRINATFISYILSKLCHMEHPAHASRQPTELAWQIPIACKQS